MSCSGGISEPPRDEARGEDLPADAANEMAVDAIGDPRLQFFSVFVTQTSLSVSHRLMSYVKILLMHYSRLETPQQGSRDGEEGTIVLSRGSSSPRRGPIEVAMEGADIHVVTLSFDQSPPRPRLSLRPRQGQNDSLWATRNVNAEVGREWFLGIPTIN